MGLSIRPAQDASFGQPRPMLLVLTCDGSHASQRQDTYNQAGYDEQCAAARTDGWQLRVGDDAKVLCRSCRRDWSGRPRVAERAMQGELF